MWVKVVETSIEQNLPPPSIFETLSNDCICQADSEKVYNLGSLHPICYRARYISRARSVHRHNGCYDPILYTFSESAWQMQSFERVLKMIEDNFWNENIFFLQISSCIEGNLGWKNIFFKNRLWSFSKHSQMTAFVKLILKRYITWGHSTRYIFARSVIRDNFWKKLFFHDYHFGFLGICPTVFWPIPGVNFMLETSSFHRSSRFWYMRRHVSAQINWNWKKFLPYTPRIRLVWFAKKFLDLTIFMNQRKLCSLLYFINQILRYW